MAQEAIKAVTFGFQGVLANRLQARTTARMHAFREKDLTTELQFHSQAHINGSRTEDRISWILEQSRGELPSDELVAELTDLQDRYYWPSAAKGLPDVRGALPLVKWAGEQFAGRLAIVTDDDSEREVRPFLSHHGLSDDFPVVIGDVSRQLTHNRPNPLPYLETAERLGISPTHMAAVESTPGGIKSAKDAGFYVVGVSGHGYSREELYAASADTAVVELFDVDRRLAPPDHLDGRILAAAGIQ